MGKKNIMILYFECTKAIILLDEMDQKHFNEALMVLNWIFIATFF